MKKIINLYFRIHQPYRLKQYRFFEIGNNHYYYDDYTNRRTMQKIAAVSYLRANRILLELIEKLGNDFRITFSISGTAIEQFRDYEPRVLDSFKALADTGQVEFVAETYAHSLASLHSGNAFINEVQLHTGLIEKEFNQSPAFFCNTALIYSDAIAEQIAEMGFKGMLTEGARHVLGWKSPNYLYYAAHTPRLKLLMSNYSLSNDIALRFCEKCWSGYPLTAEKFVEWLTRLSGKEEIINLCMNYEVFGEYHRAEDGIFDFLARFPVLALESGNFSFATPASIINSRQPVAPVAVPHPVSWVDEERDTTAWLGNEMQTEAFNRLYSLQEKVALLDDKWILRDWERLQASDHFYYMSTKYFSNSTLPGGKNPYKDPYDAFINYMNVLSDFVRRVEELYAEKFEEKHIKTLIAYHESELKRLKSKNLVVVND